MTHTIKTPPILNTKLHRPRAPKDHLHRQHLIRRLEKNRDRPLSLVSAPAGYGKSTLLSCWLESTNSPGAWVSLDENDSDIRIFLAYFIAAVQTRFPSVGNDTSALLKNPKLPPLELLTRNLVNEIDQIDKRFIMVLDDYHSISDIAVHRLIAKLLQHPSEPLHLVLSSRVDPMLPLERFRARNQMTEIRIRDLRFSLEETETFLNQFFDMPVAGNAAAKLNEKTEGWVTGLRLAALSLQHRPDPEHIIEEFPLENRYTTDYLFTEVLRDQPGEILEYLLATAILDRFCAPLCDAICVKGLQSFDCKTGGQNFLNWLEKSGLFVIPLDEQGIWFRYHHLFQQLLLRRLKHQFNAKEISELYRRASQWFSENILIDEALKYTLASGDVTSAARLVEQNRHLPLNEDKVYILDKWLSRLPDDIIQQRPELLLAKAWVYNSQFVLWAIPPLLEDIKRLCTRGSKKIPGEEMDLFSGILLFWEGRGQHSMELLGRALEGSPEANIGVRNEAELYLALSSQIAGHGKSAVQSYRKKIFNERSEGTRKLRLLATILFIHMLSGDLLEAEEMVRQIKDMTTRVDDEHVEAWVWYLEGNIQYQRNKLKAACHSFSQAMQRRFYLDAHADIESYAGLIFTFQAMGQPDKALETMTQLIDYVQALDNPNALPLAHSIQARLWLMQGDIESAGNWLDTAEISFDTGTMVFWLEVPRITQCRVLIARGAEADLAEASEKLRKYLGFGRMTHNTPQVIDILLLQTMVLHSQGQDDEAVTVLEQALTLSRPGEYIRPFLNLGNRMSELLRHPLRYRRNIDFAGQILASFSSDEAMVELSDSPAQSSRQPQVNNQAYNEPLTNRELEILSFLSQGLQNKEIAARLFISRETVKKHTGSIYRKLDSHNRQRAVAKAYLLGILNPVQ